MLVYCSLANPQSFWEKYRDSMCLDIFMQSHYTSTDMTLQFRPATYNRGLLLLEDTILEMSDHPLNSYCIESPYKENEVLCNQYLLRETCYNTARLLSYVEEREKLLNPEQAVAYNSILTMLEDTTGGILFFDAPGGTGKTFLLPQPPSCQSGQIAIAMVSSRKASTLLDCGRTVHSTFKLLFNISHVENPTTNINKNSDEAVVFQKCKLIVWDKATMSHKNALNAINTMLQDLCSNSKLFGGIQMFDNIFEATIITGKGTGKSAFIPRVPLILTDCVFVMKRVQFLIQ
uniref:ATP-dependent DNA helicase n=1 Tax=Octopus bimaculoides TaxID=37653 RepID=A0A0L8GSS9_OCTBM